MYVFGDILNTVWSAEKVFKLLDRKPNMQTGHWVPEKLNGRITFDNVTLSYPSRPEKQALKVYFFFIVKVVQKLIFQNSIIIGKAKAPIFIRNPTNHCLPVLSVCKHRTESRKDDSISWPFGWRKNLLCQSATEVL